MIRSVDAPDTASPAKPRKHPRSVRLLLDAAKQLMTDGDMAGVTIDDLVRIADVSRRSFHNHYHGKRELVEHVKAEVRAEIEASIDEANLGVTDMPSALVGALVATFRHALEHRIGQRLILDLGPGAADPANPRNSRLVGYLRAGCEAGHFDLPSIDAGLALVLALIGMSLVRLEHIGDEREAARRYIESACVQLLRGLGQRRDSAQRVVGQVLVKLMDARPRRPVTLSPGTTRLRAAGLARPVGHRAAAGPLANTSAEPAPGSTRTSSVRRALLDAGKRLLSQGLYGEASIDDIVTEAGVAKGSFYNHFSSRDELLRAVVAVVKNELKDLINQAATGIEDAATRIAMGLLRSFAYGLSNSLGCQVMLHITPDVADPGAEVNEGLALNVRRGTASGVLKVESEDVAILHLLGLSDFGLARLLDMTDEFQRSRDLMKHITLLALRGLGVESRHRAAVVDKALAVVVDAQRRAGPG